MRATTTLIFLLFLIFPLESSADFIISKPTGDPFDNAQNLTLAITKIDTSEQITNHGTTTLPVNTPVSISYTLGHKPFWPNYRVSVSDNDSLFSSITETNKIYLELWQGAPFTETAQFVQNWDISNKTEGQVTAIFPSAGQYFLVVYLPSNYYEDPQTACSDNPNWQIDCVPSYTLDQMRGYFTSSATSTEAFPYMPDAFGGITFNVLSNKLTSKNSNVLFLPGIEGSRLYSRNALGIETTLWEPSFLSNFSNLALNPDGTSKYQIYTRDLVNYKYGIKAFGDVYGPFEDFMNQLVTQGVISKWEAFPYDWRYDVRDIISNGTLIGTATGEPTRTYLQDVVQKLASSSPTGRVTIVAHSNGGLLAKALAIELEKEKKINLLDQIIFVGSPQIGTPLTIGALLNGDGQTDALGGFFMYGGDVRAAAATMPSMYGLLPSADYFSPENSPPVLFTQKSQGDLFSNYFGTMITSESALENFLSDVLKLHEKFFVDDLRTPQVLSDTLLEKEFETHTILDAWEPPPDLRLSFIAGWGNLTAYQYLYGTSDKKFFDCIRASLFLSTCSYAYNVWHTTKNSPDGDDTVISSSALANATTSQKFYFNARDFQRDKLGTIGHGNLTSAASVQVAVENILSGGNQNIPYITNTPPPKESEELTSVSVHSPVNIIATDADGNQTGIFPIPGKAGIFYEKENIPGSYLQTLDDEKYLYLPKDQSYTVSLQGYDDGFMTLDFGSTSLTGDSSTSVEFSEIPVTASTTGEIELTSISSSSSTSFPQAIQIDIFGSGSTSEFRSEGADSVTLTTENIYEILREGFAKLAVRRGIKNRFLSVLKKITNEPDRAAQLNQIVYLEKLVLAQMDSKLSHQQAMFFMRLLERLKN